jgi:hypothetical protein
VGLHQPSPVASPPKDNLLLSSNDQETREASLPRLGGHPPYEYARFRTSNFKQEKDDVDVMTESFIEARYSHHDIPPKAACQ